jgi:starch synthase
MVNVLFVASEAHPFIKTGGLGEVAFALPKTLRKLGVDIRIIIPKYAAIEEEFKTQMISVDTFTVSVGWRRQFIRLQYMEYDGVPCYFIDNEHYFKRDGVYGFYDDGERYACFCRAALEALKYINGFAPDIIHCNDWQTAAVITLLKAFYSFDNIYENIGTIFTIHNLKYQGILPKEALGDLLGLDWSYFVEDKLKFYDNISLVKGALNMTDKITTVSSTYAEEITTPYYGEGLDGLISYRCMDLSGIVNGIDTDTFNPETDMEIYDRFSIGSLETKLDNKEKLQIELGLAVNREVPMIAIVSRLVRQKGIDLIACVIEELLSMDIQIVVLGSGEECFENMFRYYAYRYPHKVSANIYFDSSLAKKIYASSDMFLMPSLFEPCGIGQLIALRYGSLPIVRETGGLKDTVISYNEVTEEGNGFSFSNYNAHDMLYTIRRAVGLYKDKELWNKLVTRAMSEDNSWYNSAQKYVNLYKTVISNVRKG